MPESDCMVVAAVSFLFGLLVGYINGKTWGRVEGVLEAIKVR